MSQTVCLPLQAIQDITRNRDIDPEEIVSLIFERIDVKGEGKEQDAADDITVKTTDANGSATIITTSTDSSTTAGPRSTNFQTTNHSRLTGLLKCYRLI